MYFTGIHPDVARVLSKKLKFTFNCSETEDGLFGSFNPKSGRWSGLVGAVVEGRADFVLGSLAFSQAR